MVNTVDGGGHGNHTKATEHNKQTIQPFVPENSCRHIRRDVTLMPLAIRPKRENPAAGDIDKDTHGPYITRRRVGATRLVNTVHSFRPKHLVSKWHAMVSDREGLTWASAYATLTSGAI
jgi:hypothetical protein